MAVVQGMLDDAIMTYKEAIAREPNFPEAYNNLVRPLWLPLCSAPCGGRTMRVLRDSSSHALAWQQTKCQVSVFAEVQRLP